MPDVIVLGKLAASFGSMAAFGVSFYVITNGLAIILIGIAVADSIHIMSQVYEERARNPNLPSSRGPPRNRTPRHDSNVETDNTDYHNDDRKIRRSLGRCGHAADEVFRSVRGCRCRM